MTHSQKLAGLWRLQSEPRAGSLLPLLDDHPVVAMHGEPKTPSREGLFNVGVQGCIQPSASQLAAGERERETWWERTGRSWISVLPAWPRCELTLPSSFPEPMNAQSQPIIFSLGRT